MITLGKRTYGEKEKQAAMDDLDCDEEDSKKKKKDKKHKKDKKDKKSKKEKKEKKEKKRAKKEEDIEAENDRNKDREERWVPPERNPWTGKPYSDKFFDILQKRKELPAWQARQQVLDLVNEY